MTINRISHYITKESKQLPLYQNEPLQTASCNWTKNDPTNNVAIRHIFKKNIFVGFVISKKKRTKTPAIHLY